MSSEPVAQAMPGDVLSVAVELDCVSKRFDATPAVDGVSLRIGEGEFFSLLGPSGSGKTTCLRMIAGFETPSEGRIVLHGRDVTGVPPYERDVNTVFQDYALFPHMHVADNVGYGLMVRRVPKQERSRRVAEALAMVRLNGFEARKPGQLSGGQRQRVALARALINRPRILLLDEPLGALDLKLRQEMQIELKGIQREVGITFIYVTHDQEEALTMSDRLAVFNRGRIEQVGTPVEVYERPRTEFVAGFVGTSNILDASQAAELLGGDGPCSIRPEKIRFCVVGETSSPHDVAAFGTIRDAVFLGSSMRYVVELDLGPRLVVVEQNAGNGSGERRQAGTRVQLVWSREHCLPLSAG